MIKIPYTFKVILPVIGWGLLCSFFSYTLSLTIVESSIKFLIYGAPLYLIFLGLIFIVRYGYGSFSKEAKLINKNIDSKGVLKEKLSDEDTRNVLESLVAYCKELYMFSFSAGLSFVAFTVLIISFDKGTLEEFLIILISSLIGLFFFSSFSLFFSQQAVFPVVKKCREVLFKSKENSKNIVLSSIKSKFYFLFFFPFISVLIVIISVYPVNYSTIILALTGLTMALIIGRVLYVYVYRSFSEIEKFSRVSGDKDNIFVVGSLDKEFVDLANNFSKISQELDSLKKESEKSKKEMTKKMEELERFFDLTVDRENKMVELKKELEKLKNV